MNNLQKLKKYADKWFSSGSKDSESARVKSRILGSTIGLGKVYSYKEIAEINGVSEQYARVVVKKFFEHLESERVAEYEALKQNMGKALKKILPAEINLCKDHLVKHKVVPESFNTEALDSLLAKAKVNMKTRSIGTRSCIFFAEDIPTEQQIRQLESNIATTLRIKLLATLSVISRSVREDEKLVLLCLANDSRIKKIKGKYYVLDDYAGRFKTEFTYLICKMFSVYRRFSEEELVNVIRRPTRLKCDVEYLEIISDDLILEALVESGLIKIKQGYCYGEGDKDLLTDCEEEIVSILLKASPLTASAIKSQAMEKGFTNSNCTSVITKSPLLKQMSRNWYSLYPNAMR